MLSAIVVNLQYSLYAALIKLLFNSLSLSLSLIFRVSCSQTSHCSLSTQNRYRLPMPYLLWAVHWAICRTIHHWLWTPLLSKMSWSFAWLQQNRVSHVPQTWHAQQRTNFEKYLQRVVKSLKVRCSDYKEGCEWVGELRDLHDHLDPAKGRCGIACPFGCGKYGRRSEMREHSRRHCHKRMISCENCSYYNTFTIVTEKHYPICPARSPIDCPNQHCPVEGLRRHQLEQHLNECSHQLVDCPNTGCSVRLPRGEMKLHTLQQHNLVLEETNQAVAITPATVSPQYLYNQAPMEFIINDFSEKKEANEVWYSSPFYTHNRGYMSSVSTVPQWWRYQAVVLTFQYMLKLMRGEYDNELEWPFEGDFIRVELLNWKQTRITTFTTNTVPSDRYSDTDSTLLVSLSQETASWYWLNAIHISHWPGPLTQNTCVTTRSN